jgi:(p)ppGpp synthase/HD superfamily hydrolase
VAGLVINDGGSEAQAIAALLHDAVEDQGGPATLEEIKTNFGDEVRASSMSAAIPMRNRNRRGSSEAAVHRITLPRLARTPPCLVADKLDNARSMLRDYEHGPAGSASTAKNPHDHLWRTLRRAAEGVSRPRPPRWMVEGWTAVEELKRASRGGDRSSS